MKKLVLVLSLLSAMPAFADETIPTSLTARGEFIEHLCSSMGGVREQIRIKPETDSVTLSCLRVNLNGRKPADLYMVGLTRNGETVVNLWRYQDKTTGELVNPKLFALSIPVGSEAELALGL